MNNLNSIKQARISKGLTIEELSTALKIDKEIIEKLEKGIQLPKKFQGYELSYKNSIYKHLGYEINHSNFIKSISPDYTNIILTIFFILFSVLILISTSLNIYSKYNQNNEIDFQKDNVHLEIEKFISSQNLDFIDHKVFLSNLIEIDMSTLDNKIEIFSDTRSSIFYKIHYLNDNSLKFGEILASKSLVLDLNTEFLIDISNISYIDKIMFQGKTFKVDKRLDFYLQGFDIKKLSQLL